MTRLIDADALNKEFRDFVRASNNSDFEPTPNWNDAVSLVGSAPTVDAVEVVRCGECKWFDRTELSGTVEPIGYRCKLKQRFVDADDFCKYGERREE